MIAEVIALVGSVLLPLIIVGAAVQGGTRPPRPGTRRAALRWAAAVAAAIAISVAAVWRRLPARRVPQQPTASAQSSVSAERLAALDNGLRAIGESLRDAPRDRWDPDYVLGQVGRDPQALFEWVRDNTEWIPYLGTLRGRTGVLMDRRGNSLDRARLLATLLAAAGQTTRLARGDLPDEEASTLVLGPPSWRLADPGRSALVRVEPAQSRVRDVATRHHLDSAIGGTLKEAEHALMRAGVDLDARVTTQTMRLLNAVPRKDPEVERRRQIQSALSAARDHWWVQHRDGDRWIDLDVLAPAGTAAASLRETFAHDELPADLHHTVVVRVVSERSASGATREERVLEHSFRPSDVAGQSVVLQFWPGSWPAEIAPDPESRYGAKAAALEQQNWAALLMVGRTSVAQAIIDAAAEPGARASSNPFTRIGDALGSKPQNAQDRRAELTAVWIEYEAHVPGQASRTTRRVVFDLPGPAKRANGRAAIGPLDETQRLIRSLALTTQTEILAMANGVPAEYVAHVALGSVHKNRDLLRAIVAGNLESGARETDSQVTEAQPAVSPLLAFAAMRLELNASAAQVYLDRPNIVTRHRSLVQKGNAVRAQDVIDIVENEVGVDLAASDSFAVRLQQGVVDTNTEAFIAGGDATTNTALAFAAPGDWVTVTPDERTALARVALPDDARHRMTRDLDAGFVVMAPITPHGRPGESGVGWWRIDPATGDTLGMGPDGWGSSIVQYGQLIATASQAISGFAFEYLLCQGISQAVNGIKMVGEQVSGIWHPNWAGVAKSQDAGTVFVDNNKACLIGAIVFGFVATLPILLITMKARQVRLAARLAEEVAAREAEAQAAEALLKRLENALELPVVEAPPLKTIVDPSLEWKSGTTMVPRPRPGGTPAALLERERAIQAAKTNYRQAQREASTSMNEYVNYVTGRPTGMAPNPRYDPIFEEGLRARAELDFTELNRARRDLKNLGIHDLNDLGGRGGPSGGGGGGGGKGAPSRPPQPPPQPIGNNKETIPAQAVAGSAGVSGALKGG